MAKLQAAAGTRRCSLLAPSREHRGFTILNSRRSEEFAFPENGTKGGWGSKWNNDYQQLAPPFWDSCPIFAVPLTNQTDCRTGPGRRFQCSRMHGDIPLLIT